MHKHYNCILLSFCIQNEYTKMGIVLLGRMTPIFFNEKIVRFVICEQLFLSIKTYFTQNEKI